MIMYDTRSTTGSNLRHLRLMTPNCNVEELDVYSAPYEEVPDGEMWRISMLKELMQPNEDHHSMPKELLKILVNAYAHIYLIDYPKMQN